MIILMANLKKIKSQLITSELITSNILKYIYDNYENILEVG